MVTEVLEDFAGQTVLLACNHTLPGAEKIITQLLPAAFSLVSSSKPQSLITEEILAKLRGRQSVVFFPEGPLSPDGAIHRGTLDLGWLLLTAKVPIIPVAIIPSIAEDSESEWELKFGDPLDFSRYWSSKPLGDELDRLLMRAVSDDIVAALVRVSGLDYHDCSATTHQATKVPLLTRLKQGTEPAFAAERARVKMRAERREQEIADIESAEAELASPAD